MAATPIKRNQEPSADASVVVSRRHAKREIEWVKETEFEEGEGNWLVSYADMMTLLFGFFVLISAFSSPDAKKMEKLKQETAKSTGGKYVKPYEVLVGSLRKVLKESGLEKRMTIEATDGGVEIVATGTLFFDSGSTVLKAEASELVQRIAPVLVTQAKGFRVLVEGHTDSDPILSSVFPSNWELSAGRATSVVHLLESKGFPHKNLLPLGFADTNPLLPEKDEE